MVRHESLTLAARLSAVALIACLLALSMLSPALPQGMEGSDLVIEEEYTIELTPTGDAHITDVLNYDTAYFDEYAAVFDEYPNLLSRRYSGDTDVGEIENFNVDVNERKGTVTITFDSPGFAYDMGDTWDIYGFGYEPSKTRDTEMVFEGEGTLNNELTLFEEAPLNVTTTVKFPAGASGALYDAGDSAVKYVLPYVEAESGNFLQNNKSVWIPIFIVLMVLSLLLLLYVIINGRRSGAPATVETVPGAVAAPTFTPAPPAAPAPPAYPTAPAASAAPAAPVTKYCKHCGGALKESDTSFCSNCGKPLA